jgi:DNA (cytosine-5)-methyltransferase 1
MKLRVLDLFSGIGGFSLGLERTGGFETVAFCEIEPFPRRVLAKHWPGVPIYDDVRTLTAERLAADGIGVDVICGGFPCQDISLAGKGAGLAGERSGLWSEIARLAGELRPRYVIVENVSALLGRGLDRVLGDLAEIGFDAEWHCIPASAIGAPHRRDRFWLVAHAHGEWRETQSRLGTAIAGWSADHAFGGGADVADAEGVFSDGGNVHARGDRESAGASNALRELGGSRPDVPDAHHPGLEGCWASERVSPEYPSVSGARWWSAEPDVGRVAHGVPSRVDRLKGLGNAVVPQIPELIGRAILASMQEAA